MKKKIIWENLYNDLSDHVAKALREARLQPEQLIVKTDGELMAIQGITEEDVESIRKLYNADTIEAVEQAAKEAGVVEVAKEEEKTPVKKAPAKPRVRSARYQRLISKVDRNNSLGIKEAVALLTKIGKSGKVKTVELTINTRETGIRGEIKLPHSTGKEVKIAIFSSTVEKNISAGKTDFDILLATPADMPKLARYAKILGPKGLMPNPKSGTITPEPEKRAKELKSGGTLPYKTESKSPIIHLALGPVSQSEKDLADNIKEVIKAIGPLRIKSAFLSCTHTPSIRLNVTTI